MQYGIVGNLAALVIAFPQYYAAYYVMKKMGMPSLLEMPKSYKDAAKQFVIGTLAWDTLLFWIHYGLHKVPWLYRNIHKVGLRSRQWSTVLCFSIDFSHSSALCSATTKSKPSPPSSPATPISPTSSSWTSCPPASASPLQR